MGKLRYGEAVGMYHFQDVLVISNEMRNLTAALGAL